MPSTGADLNAERRGSVATEAITGGLALVLGATGMAVAGAGVAISGAAVEDWNSGDDMSFIRRGRCTVLAGAAVTAGVQVTPDANGKFVAATTGDIIAGNAITAAGAENDLFDIDLDPTLDEVPA